MKLFFLLFSCSLCNFACETENSKVKPEIEHRVRFLLNNMSTLNYSKCTELFYLGGCEKDSNVYAFIESFFKSASSVTTILDTNKLVIKYYNEAEKRKFNIKIEGVKSNDTILCVYDKAEFLSKNNDAPLFIKIKNEKIASLGVMHKSEKNYFMIICNDE